MFVWLSVWLESDVSAEDVEVELVFDTSKLEAYMVRLDADHKVSGLTIRLTSGAEYLVVDPEEALLKIEGLLPDLPKRKHAGSVVSDYLADRRADGMEKLKI